MGCPTTLAFMKICVWSLFCVVSYREQQCCGSLGTFLTFKLVSSIKAAGNFAENPRLARERTN